jgi:hypothetical protein
MKKLILGIAAVFCLQAVFIGYHATNPLPGMASITYSGRTGEAVDASVLDQLSSESEFVDDTTPDEVAFYRPPSSRSARTGPVERPVAIAKKFTARTNRTPQTESASLATSAKVIFRNEYAAVVITPASDEHDLTASDAPREEKRSFIVNVIKKPYGLIKAIGSKFK